MRHVVVDEADMLLGGSFEKATLELLGLLRRYDRDIRGLALAEALGMEWGALKALPRLVLQAGLAGGTAQTHEIHCCGIHTHFIHTHVHTQQRTGA